MFLDKEFLRERLKCVVETMEKQGYEVEGLIEQIDNLPDSYDAFDGFARSLISLEFRKGWQFTEPVEWDEIVKEMDPGRPFDFPKVDIEICSKKAEAAFLGSVMGCILGKPLEINPTYEQLKSAGEAIGEWPISDYISEAFLDMLGDRHPSWTLTTRGNINFVAADDDLHYNVLGMINLEDYGLKLNYEGVRRTWQKHQCIDYVFGPERNIFYKIAENSLKNDNTPLDNNFYKSWALFWNPGSEQCGAAIRADAYGYAFPGRPDLASYYAFIDASFSHVRTGVYATMFLAAAISLMFVAEDPLEAVKTAAMFVPQNSRFYKITEDCLNIVEDSEDWEGAYYKINKKYGQYGHCQVYQEIGTLLNTLKYAENVWDGVCRQVMQGCDTDSFGCTAGSMLGALFGYEGIDMSKINLFNDTIQLGLANFFETSLEKLTRRMGGLCKRFIF